MSFERDNLRPDSGMVANFAEGITKTSELVFSFHSGENPKKTLKKIVSYVIDSPITYADPMVYSNSNVYGKFLPRTKKYSDFERTIDYNFIGQFLIKIGSLGTECLIMVIKNISIKTVNFIIGLIMSQRSTLCIGSNL